MLEFGPVQHAEEFSFCLMVHQMFSRGETLEFGL